MSVVADYLHPHGQDWSVRENANMAFSLQGLNNHISSSASKEYWLKEVYSEDVEEAHRSGLFHIHDLSLLAPYCVGWDLQALLREGFGGVPGKVASRPAKRFRTALGQITNFMYTLQGEAAGAQAFSNVDTLLAPYIHRDGLNYAEVKQAIQEWLFSLNVPTRVGFQTPFTNISLDLDVPPHMSRESVVIDGQVMGVYGAYQTQMDVFNQAFWDVMHEGDADGRPFTFPIPTYSITKRFNYLDPRYAMFWRLVAKYGTPYFANYVNSGMSPEDTRSMCCRLRLDISEMNRRGGGLFGPSPLTGSVGVVTLNLPRVAAVYQDEYFARLRAVAQLALKALQQKREAIERFTDMGLYPYSARYLRAIKGRTGRYWSNHFDTLGILGANEASVNVTGESILTETGKAFAHGTLDTLRDVLANAPNRCGAPRNLEATPAEGASARLRGLDEIHVPNSRAIRQGLPYTNSTMPPVEAFAFDPVALADHQEDLQVKYTGGTVVHFYLGELAPDPMGVAKFVHRMCEHTRLPYVTVTPTFSVCQKCGRQQGRHEYCPHCGERCEVYSRVVGYYRPVSQWHGPKQAEFDRRATFDGLSLNAGKE